MVEAVETDITVEGTEEGAEIQVKKKRSRARAKNLEHQFGMLCLVKQPSLVWYVVHSRMIHRTDADNNMCLLHSAVFNECGVMFHKRFLFCSS